MRRALGDGPRSAPGEPSGERRQCRQRGPFGYTGWGRQHTRKPMLLPLVWSHAAGISITLRGRGHVASVPRPRSLLELSECLGKSLVLSEVGRAPWAEHPELSLLSLSSPIPAPCAPTPDGLFSAPLLSIFLVGSHLRSPRFQSGLWIPSTSTTPQAATQTRPWRPDLLSGGWGLQLNLWDCDSIPSSSQRPWVKYIRDHGHQREPSRREWTL